MSPLLRLLRLAATRPWAYTWAFAGLVAGTILFLLLPQQLGLFLQDMARTGGSDTMRIGARVCLILFLQALVMTGYSFLVSITAERIGNDLRERYYARLLVADINATRARLTGAIASEFSSDIAMIQAGLSDTLTSSLRHIVFVIGAITAMLMVDWPLALVTLAAVSIAAIILLLFVQRATRASLAVQAARADVLSLIVEGADNSYVIQAYGREAWFFDRFRAANNRAFAKIMGQSRLIAAVNPVSMLFFIAALMGIFIMGTHRIAVGAISMASLIAVLTYAVILVSSISNMGMATGKLQQSAALLARHQAVLAAPLPILPHAGDPQGGGGPIGVTVRDVTFHYPRAVRPSLSAINIALAPGSVTAVIGRSGAGKSTLAALLAAVTVAGEGSVIFSDGCAANGRGRIAVVPQEPFLFSGTVFDNIVLGRTGIDIQKVRTAARLAQIDDVVIAFTEGYDHVLHEGGRNLSRGQQQRLALARALVTDPGLLILDEATASLDVASERAIGRTITALRGHVTVVVIAHQGELLRDVDDVVALDNGTVTYAGCASGCDPYSFLGEPAASLIGEAA